MSKPILSAATERAFRVIAHVGMADDISNKVSGMADFGKHYRSTLTPGERKIVERFQAICRKARQDFLQALEQDQP